MILSAYREPAKEWNARVRLGLSLPGRRLQVVGAHTWHEANLALDARGQETELVLVTSPYHRLRAYLTFIQALIQRGLDQRVRLVIANGMGTPSAEEQEKIASYRAKGHVASEADCDRYEDFWYPCATS